MKRQTPATIALLICFLLSTTSCGWHLRGITPMPEALQIMHLFGYEGTGIYEELALQLEFNGVLLTTNFEDAPVTINITEYKIEKRTLSLNALGQESDYELDGRLLVNIERQLTGETSSLEVTSRRILINDVTNPVATQQEEAQLILELDADLSRKLLRRIQRLDSTTSQ